MIEGTKENNNRDALMMVYVRNAFYKEKYFFALGIYLLSIILIFILICMLYYLAKKPNQPIYFVADKVGRLMPDVPISAPNMSADDVAAWIVEAVQSAYSYDYINYRDQLQNAEVYFTDYGWRKYMDGLRVSNNLIALTERKLIVTAQVINKPKLLVQGLLHGAYAWKFEVPLLITYMPPPYDGKTNFENPLLLTIVVGRQSMLNSYKGLGIVQMIATLATQQQPQSLSPTPEG